jgi:hypothetical protein
MKNILLVGAVAMVMLNGQAAGNTGRPTSIRGNISCESWIKERNEANKGGKGEIGVTLNRVYLLGFLSGLSSGTGIEFFNKDGERLEDESIFLWMDNFCKAIPSTDIYDGAYTLFIKHTTK